MPLTDLPTRSPPDLVTNGRNWEWLRNYQLVAGDLGPNSIGASEIGSLPAARVSHNANQSITASTLTTLAFNLERYDTDTIHDTVTNNSRLTAKTAGVYDIKANISWAVSATGTIRQINLVLNGTTTILVDTRAPTGASFGPGHSVACDYKLAVNDYVEVVVYQDTAGALNITTASNYSPEFSMSWIGDG